MERKERLRGGRRLELLLGKPRSRAVINRSRAAREGSAEYKMIVRQLTGLREGSEIGCLIFEEFSINGYEIP